MPGAKKRKSDEKLAMEAGMVISDGYVAFLETGDHPTTDSVWDYLCLEDGSWTAAQIEAFREAIRAAIRDGRVAVIKTAHKTGDGARLLAALGESLEISASH